MDLDELSRQTEALRQRVGALLQHVDELPRWQQELLTETFFTLQPAWEELQVAALEWRQPNEQQNQELAAARSAKEAFRQRYQELFETAAVGYLMTTPEGTIQEANRAAATLLNISQKLLVGKSLFTFVAEQERLALQSQLTQARVGDWVYSLEVCLQPLGYILVDVALTVTAVRNELGELVALLWQLRDLTSSKRIEAALREKQERLELAQKAAKLGSFEWNIQTDVNIWSKELEALYGLRPGKFGGSYQHWARCVHPEDLAKVEAEVQTSLVTGEFFTDFRVVWSDGSIHWLHARAKVFFDDEGKPLRMVGVNVDITQRKQAEAALCESEAKFRSLIQNSSDIIGILDPSGTIRYASPSTERVLGYNPEELLGKNIFELIHPEDILESHNNFNDLIQIQNLSVTIRIECRWRRKDGSWCFLESTGSNLLAESSVKGLVINSRDITDRKIAEKQLIHDALHDALTDLPNRALFMERLRHALEYSKRHSDYLFAVLFLDLDRFKLINDSLGHRFGDQLLLTIAQRLKGCLRPTDVAARLGGDEFTILLEGIKDISNAIRVAERIQAELRLPVVLEQQEVFTAASIGIAVSAANYNRPEDLLRDADTAMYRAKALGRGRYEIFNTDMHIQAVARWQLENDLRRAIERQEFLIHYQPLVSLQHGRIIGFEALVRWQHPRQGLLLPTDFLPLAVELGISIQIDHWVLAQACRQTKQWQEQYRVGQSLTISVNVGSPQLAQLELVEYVNQVLQSTNLDAHSLQLELTESVIMENSNLAMTKLAQLRALGIQILVDDFGTGYSSLGRLHRFPINGLKIDRSFISGSGVDEGNLDIVETIVTLAQKLGVNVTAEGVETVEQLAQLRTLKCEYGQGYFFSPPLDKAAAEALIVAAPRW